MPKLAQAIDGKDKNFSYDGDQMIVSTDLNGATIFWETVWGDGVDQLIEHEVYQAGVPTRHVPLTDHSNSSPYPVWKV